jgi:antirestriction protein ArdC
MNDSTTIRPAVEAPAAAPTDPDVPRSTPDGRRKQLQDRIDKLCARILAGDDACFADYLKQQALFHGYSWRNTLLIWSQYPHARQVGGLKSHWNKVGRRVRKGEKAIWILAPMTFRQTDDEAEEEIKTWFKPVPVFDVSQTEGRELADWRDRYAGTVDLLPALQALARAKGHVVIEDVALPAHGLINRKGEIHLLAEDEPERKVLTLTHELAHGQLSHHTEKLPREVKEAEAEAIACVVLAHWGHQGYDVSAGYIRSWGRTAEAGVKLVKESLARIADAARVVIDDLEAILGGTEASVPLAETA